MRPRHAACDNRPVWQPTDTGRKTGTQAIERAIAILRLFARTDTPLTLTEVARTVELNTATTHRILATLVRERLLANDAASERYRIGPDSLLLFAAAARRYGIAAARSELELLAEVTHETSRARACSTATTRSWSCRSSPTCRCGSPERSAPASRGTCRRWARRSSHSPANDLPTARRSARRARTGSPITRSSTAARLVAELEQVRDRGWAINDSERYDGVRAFAVPILHAGEPARAAVGLQGPSDRLPDSRIDELVEALRAAPIGSACTCRSPRSDVEPSRDDPAGRAPGRCSSVRGLGEEFGLAMPVAGDEREHDPFGTERAPSPPPVRRQRPLPR